MPTSRSHRSEFSENWPVLAASTIGVGVGVSALPFYTAGLFFGPLRTEFGWTHADTATGSLALALGIALGVPVAGRLVDRFGARLVALPSLLLEAAMFLALSRLNGSAAAYVATLFAMGLLGAGASPLAFTDAVNGCFNHFRGLALGICLMGAGAAAVLAPILLIPIITGGRWRLAYLVLALVVLAAAPTTLFLGTQARIRDGSAPEAHRAGFAPTLADIRFWIVLSASAVGAAGIAAVVIHLVPILTEQKFSATAAAQRASAVGVAVILGRLATGAALDRLPTRLVSGAIMTASALGCLLLAGAAAHASLAAALLLGAGLGAEVDIVSFLCAREFGLSVYGRAYGIIYSATLVAAGAGPFAFGLVADRRGYGLALIASAGAVLLSAILFSCIRTHRPAP